jgi:hypothetical protein
MNMARKPKSEADPVKEEPRKSRTISVTDSEWAEICAAAEAEGRKPSRHIVLINRQSLG